MLQRMKRLASDNHIRLYSFFGRMAIAFGAAVAVGGCSPLSNAIAELPQLPELPEISNIAQRTSPPAAPAQSPNTAAIEEQVRQQINRIRQQQGLSELENNPKLAEVARRYSQRMSQEGFFSHTSPAGDSMVQRVQSAGIVYWMIGENLFTSTNIPQPVSAAVDGWMKSPGHRENILRPEYRETGIGVWRNGNTYHITQLFLRSII